MTKNDFCVGITNNHHQKENHKIKIKLSSSSRQGKTIAITFVKMDLPPTLYTHGNRYHCHCGIYGFTILCTVLMYKILVMRHNVIILCQFSAETRAELNNRNTHISACINWNLSLFDGIEIRRKRKENNRIHRKQKKSSRMLHAKMHGVLMMIHQLLLAQLTLVSLCTCTYTVNSWVELQGCILSMHGQKL